MAADKKAEREQKMAELRSRTEMVLAAVEKQAKEAAEAYSEPLLGRDHDVSENLSEIAKELSSRYKNVRFTVSYENGYPQLFAEPAKLRLPGVDTEDERTIKSWEDAVLRNTLFPKIAEMRGFATGFSLGWRNRGSQESQRRRDDERRGTDRIPHPMDFYYLGPPPFSRRW